MAKIDTEQTTRVSPAIFQPLLALDMRYAAGKPSLEECHRAVVALRALPENKSHALSPAEEAEALDQFLRSYHRRDDAAYVLAGVTRSVTAYALDNLDPSRSILGGEQGKEAAVMLTSALSFVDLNKRVGELNGMLQTEEGQNRFASEVKKAIMTTLVRSGGEPGRMEKIMQKIPRPSFKR